MNLLFNRFKDADWFGTNQEILLVGLGGIGKGTAEQLCLLGHNLYIYETDAVEEHNCIPQGYYKDQVGLTKIKAFSDNIQRYGLSLPEFMIGNYDESSMAAPIMISCVDNMKCRFDMFNNWKKQEDRQLFIDGRMLAEYFEVFTVTPDNQDLYEEYLFSDADVPTMNCTYQQTRFCASGIQLVILQQFNNWLSNKSYEIDARSLPFKIVYNGMLTDLTHDSN